MGAGLAVWVIAAVLLAAVCLATVGFWKVYGAQQRILTVLAQWHAAVGEADQRGQAELVCAWPVSERETFEKVIQRGVVGAAVRNVSQLPVYQVELIYRDPAAAWTAIRHIALLPPDEAPQIYAGFDTDETTGEPSPDRINADGTIRLAPSAQMRLELRFTDGAGRRWIRAEDGILRHVDGTAG